MLRESKQPLEEGEEETEKAGLKLEIFFKNEDHGILSHYFKQIQGEKLETVTDVIVLHSKITADGDCSYEVKRPLPPQV